ncbi:MAG TPA: hypothetical protein VKT82_27285 [Ktedonobacterales bacterium]|nr:hypothetical protein [Ktedonobacterales bacterium]
MFGCLTTIVSRLVFLGVWIWTPLVSRAFDSNWIIPLLGILFLPCTALVWVWAYAPGIGVTGWGWFWVVIAFLVDIAAHGSGTRRATRRRDKRASMPA